MANVESISPIINFSCPQNFTYVSIVFNFSWDDCMSQEKLKTMLLPFFFLGGGGHTICIMGDVEVANSNNNMPLNIF